MRIKHLQDQAIGEIRHDEVAVAVQGQTVGIYKVNFFKCLYREIMIAAQEVPLLVEIVLSLLFGKLGSRCSERVQNSGCPVAAIVGIAAFNSNEALPDIKWNKASNPALPNGRE